MKHFEGVQVAPSILERGDTMKTFDVLTPQPELGATCRGVREDNNLSVIEFANKIGMTRQAVYNFEKGKTASMDILRGYLRLAKGEL